MLRRAPAAIITLAIIVAAIVAALLAIRSGSHGSPQYGAADPFDHGAAFSASMAAWVADAGDGSSVDLRTFSPVEFDSLVVIGPYSSQSQIDAALGFPWPQAERSGIRDSDGVTLLIFLRGQDVVMAVDHPRAGGDFASNAFPHGTRLKGSVVRLMRDAAGFPKLEHVADPAALGP